MQRIWLATHISGKTEWDSSRQLLNLSPKNPDVETPNKKKSPDHLTTQKTKTMGITVLLSTKFPGTGLKFCGLSAVSALLRQKCTSIVHTVAAPDWAQRSMHHIHMQRNNGHIEYPKGMKLKTLYGKQNKHEDARKTLKPTLQPLRCNNMETRPIFQHPGAWRSRNANFAIAVGDDCMLCDLRLNSRNCKIGSVQKVLIFCVGSLNRAHGARFWLQTWTKSISCPVLASSQVLSKRQMTDEGTVQQALYIPWCQKGIDQPVVDVQTNHGKCELLLIRAAWSWFYKDTNACNCVVAWPRKKVFTGSIYFHPKLNSIDLASRENQRHASSNSNTGKKMKIKLQWVHSFSYSCRVQENVVFQ